MICIDYIQGELNIFSIYRFMLSVSHIEEFDLSSLYDTRVQGGFTSSLIHYILYFMWLGSSHLFSYKCMYAGGANFTSLLFMNVISHICLYFLFFLRPIVDELTKGGEVFGEFIYAYLLFISFPCLSKKGKRIWWVYACLFSYLCIYVLFDLCILLNIFMIIAMHELRGSFFEA